MGFIVLLLSTTSLAVAYLSVLITLQLPTAIALSTPALSQLTTTTTVGTDAISQVKSTIYRQDENYEDMHRWEFDWFFSPVVPDFPKNAQVNNLPSGTSSSSQKLLQNCTNNSNQTVAGASYLIQFGTSQSGGKKQEGQCLANFNKMSKPWSVFNATTNPNAMCFEATFTTGPSLPLSKAGNSAAVILCCNPDLQEHDGSGGGVRPLGHVESVQTEQGYYWTIFLESAMIEGCKKKKK